MAALVTLYGYRAHARWRGAMSRVIGPILLAMRLLAAFFSERGNCKGAKVVAVSAVVLWRGSGWEGAGLRLLGH